MTSTPGVAMPRGGRQGPEQGSATVVLVAGVGLILVVLLAGLAVASAVTAAHRARAGADLGALAGAVALNRGASPGRACAHAALLAQRNATRLSSCAVAPDGSVSVAVSAPIGWTLPHGGPVMAKARARAGPWP